MDRYVVIGNPVAHSLSPEIHARFARDCGEDLEYTKLQVPIGEFEAEARRFFAAGGRGANVTLPFKVDAFAFARVGSDRARLAGAANVLIAREGEVAADNTDGAGLVADLTANLGIDARGKRIALLGAGGAARGVLAPLLALAPAAIVIANRTPRRAVELAERFAALGPVSGASFEAIVPGGFEIVINATSSSTRGEALEIPEGMLAPGVLAYDMAYGAAARPFLERAARSGARACDGLGMLVEQAAESFLLWRGKRPRTREVLAELRARLA